MSVMPSMLGSMITRLSIEIRIGYAQEINMNPLALFTITIGDTIPIVSLIDNDQAIFTLSCHTVYYHQFNFNTRNIFRFTNLVPYHHQLSI
ncbi:hypothetical protein BLOT_012979 [Blomia tropicalis]|nr:hypothetical protein BLOT_012979 [Blomia tropicalis]